MKRYTYIDPNCEEEKVLIYARENSKLISEIEELIDGVNRRIVGVDENDREQTTVIINPLDTTCFISENNKVFALVKDKKYRIKEKLYMIEEMEFMNYYVRLNQSCIANIKEIKEFKSSIGGALNVIFKNGYEDYISRRELKNVKERMGL